MYANFCKKYGKIFTGWDLNSDLIKYISCELEEVMDFFAL